MHGDSAGLAEFDAHYEALRLPVGLRAELQKRRIEDNAAFTDRVVLAARFCVLLSESVEGSVIIPYINGFGQLASLIVAQREGKKVIQFWISDDLEVGVLVVCEVAGDFYVIIHGLGRLGAVSNEALVTSTEPILEAVSVDRAGLDQLEDPCLAWRQR